MRLHIRMNCEFPRRPIRFACIALAAIGVALISIAAPARPQNHEYGYSYLRMEIEGLPITNFVDDPKYQGWLQLDYVEARTLAAVKTSSNEIPSGDIASKTKKAEPQWTTLPLTLSSGRGRAGEIRFGAGDSGGFDPAFNAQERKSLIASAELDLYEASGGAFIGKYRLKGIRVLSLEDAPNSACAMYLVTMSFQSVEKI